jgi:hypothetical protein
VSKDGNEESFQQTTYFYAEFARSRSPAAAFFALLFRLLRSQFASVFERVDNIDIFIAPYGFDPWKTQRKSTRMARAWLN